MRFLAVGVSHHTAPLELREILSKTMGALPEALAHLTKTGAIREACVVSTCNRVELYVFGSSDPEQLSRDVRQFLQNHCGLSHDQIDPYLYFRPGSQGLTHLFRVASSLDSMVLGEPQILGQVKEAYRTALAARAIGPELSRIFQRAFQVAKRVRSETGIAENAVSMSFAAVKLGGQIFEELTGKNVLLIGAGKMSTLAGKHLLAAGVGEICVANRSIERATELAREVGGHASSLADLDVLLAKADIVISSTAAPGYVVEKSLMSRVMRSRRYRPILFVDLAVPRDIDPDLTDLDNVFVYDVDDLQSVVQENQKSRAKEAAAAELIIGTEIEAFARWAQTQRVVPVIKALREHATRIADAEAERTLSGLKGADPKLEKSVRAMSQAIINKMLHPVLTELRNRGAEGNPAHLVEALEQLFSLQIPAEPDAALETPDREDENVVPLRRASDEP